jgi:hypothetical protein
VTSSPAALNGFHQAPLPRPWTNRPLPPPDKAVPPPPSPATRQGSATNTLSRHPTRQCHHRRSSLPPPNPSSKTEGQGARRRSPHLYRPARFKSIEIFFGFSRLKTKCRSCDLECNLPPPSRYTSEKHTSPAFLIWSWIKVIKYKCNERTNNEKNSSREKV